MPVEIDPAWEYWAPHPEIQWVFDVSAARFPRGFLPGLDGPGTTTGMRYGRGRDTAMSAFRTVARATRETRTIPRVTCAACGWDFVPARPGPRFCSLACRDDGLAPATCLGCLDRFRPRCLGQRFCCRLCELNPAPTCRTCQTAFRPSRPGLTYCSRKCARQLTGAGAAKLLPVPCRVCRLTFQPKRSCRVYCSRKCARQVNGSGGRKATVVTPH